MILRSGPCPDLMPSCIDAVTRLAADGVGAVTGVGDSDRGLRTVAPLSSSEIGAQLWPNHKHTAAGHLDRGLAPSQPADGVHLDAPQVVDVLEELLVHFGADRGAGVRDRIEVVLGGRTLPDRLAD